MYRRTFISMLGSAAMLSLREAWSQTPRKLPRIGVLVGFKEGDPEAKVRLDALFQKLRELGWIEGQTVGIDSRWTPDVKLMTTYAQELVALRPDVLLGVSSSRAVAALQAETDSIPILFVNTTDPVGGGLVASLSRPVGNLTGFTNFEYSIGGKWLDVLKRIAPNTARAALIFNPDTAPHAYSYVKSFEAASASNGVEPKTLNVRTVDEMMQAMSDFGGTPNGGLIITNDIFLARNRAQVIARSIELGLPTVYPFRFFAADGGLISYGADAMDIHRRAATYVDRLLKGEKAANLPVQQPTKFETVINLKTAKKLGLEIPPSMLAIADELIE
jgi:putative ABC transport system substrate-binding protein